MSSVESLSPHWTNERLTKKKALLCNKIKNPYCMSLKTFPTNKHQRLTRQPGVNFKTRSGVVFNPITPLEILRGTLQKRINKDIHCIFQYYAQYFYMAVENMRENYGADSVTEEHVLTVFRNSLEAAKDLFQPSGKHTGKDRHEDNSHKINVKMHLDKMNLTSDAVLRRNDDDDCDEPERKRSKHNQDNGSTFSLRPPPRIQTRKRKGRPPAHHRDYTDVITTSSSNYKGSKVKVEPVKKEGPKWDPSRLVPETMFVMGAKANKALGLGATRGRLYIKHPELFKYAGDQEDKLWLYDNHLMPATGGKAYILLLDDVLHLAETEEYKECGSLAVEELQAFKVTPTILQKMKRHMETHRTDGDGSNNSSDNNE
ncbi:deoxynucleotidyltransferase terminal-interacting protein 1-like isoform X2 [Lytechinus variegatus]|nr:deoxynucleotidyltransferase terminal-interacting protein 1-like isoform X2 [Lytechinus variegatus]XP_041456181.1 deoxynucleotidyltransferase terminal-interacting protein 1-like isoform X2 [Lytechinus variegatus]